MSSLRLVIPVFVLASYSVKSVLILPSSLGLILTKWGLTLTFVRNYGDYHVRHKHRAFSFLWFSGILRKIAKSASSLVMSVRPSAWNNSASAGHVSIQFYMRVFLENLPRKFKFHEYLTRISGILVEDKCTLLITSRTVLLTMRNMSDKSCGENQNTNFVLIMFFPPKILLFKR